jgi:hypothetical protein
MINKDSHGTALCVDGKQQAPLIANGQVENATINDEERHAKAFTTSINCTHCVTNSPRPKQLTASLVAILQIKTEHNLQRLIVKKISPSSAASTSWQIKRKMNLCYKSNNECKQKNMTVNQAAIEPAVQAFIYHNDIYYRCKYYYKLTCSNALHFKLGGSVCQIFKKETT